MNKIIIFGMILSNLTLGLFLTVKALRDESKINDLSQKLFDEQTDNQNLQYQLSQCRILYRGI